MVLPAVGFYRTPSSHAVTWMLLVGRYEVILSVGLMQRQRKQLITSTMVPTVGADNLKSIRLNTRAH